MKIDAHCHTDCSDGNVTIEERIQMIKDAGYGAATITDHDFVSEEMVRRAKKAAGDIPFIPGIEFSLMEAGKTVHLLGYYIDPAHPDLQAQIQKAQDLDKAITTKILEAYRPLGVNFEIDDLLSDSLHTFYSLQFIRRVAREFFDNDGSKMMPYFLETLNKLKLSYAEFAPWPVRDAIDLIHKTGGIAVFAHPGGADDPVMQTLGFILADEDLIKKFVDWGVDGIEASHPCHNQKETVFLSTQAAKYGLLETAGSDCHGDDPYLGPKTMGVFTDIPDDLYEQMEKCYHDRH